MIMRTALTILLLLSSTFAYGIKDNYLYMLNHVCKQSKLRPNDDPFITGDTFRSFADHVYDETDCVFSASSVKAGDIIFVNTYFLFDFFTKEHPFINYPYVLITHNSDFYAPGEFIRYLEEDKIFAWFGINCDSIHNKFIPIPIGICNKWSRGYPTSTIELLSNKQQKSYFCYCNFSLGTNYNIRKSVEYLFVNSSFVKYVRHCKPSDYLDYIVNSKFIISPPGRGIDCYRTWESLYLNSIPIVISSHLNKLYEELPVVVVNNWQDVTEDFLKEQYLIIQANKHKYNYQKLKFNYWWNQIEKTKQDCRLAYNK
jgi:hypothetical protein